MTFVPHLQTDSLTLGHETPQGDFMPVVEIGLSGNNERPQRSGRLHFGFKDSYPAEIEIEPGPNCHPKGNIVSQIMQWGPTTPDGRKRNRITTSIVTDPAGGLSCVIDSSTNEPSGSEGQEYAMPLVLNVGEAKGTYIVLFADGRVRLSHTQIGKTPAEDKHVEYLTTVEQLIATLARNE